MTDINTKRSYEYLEDRELEIKQDLERVHSRLDQLDLVGQLTLFAVEVDPPIRPPRKITPADLIA